jgi:hypothetical protein
MVLPPCHYGFQLYTRELSSDERNDLLYKIGGNHKKENCLVMKNLKEKQSKTVKYLTYQRAISLM